MSRIGKKPVPVPANVKVNHNASARTVEVEGPKGKLAFHYVPDVAVKWDDAEKKIICTIPEERHDDPQTRALWGTTRSRIAGMVAGVTQGFQKKLEVSGVGWNARLQGRTLQLNVGYSKPRQLEVPQGIECTIEGSIITVSGHDKQLVGQFAAEIRDQRRPEPYNAKGIKYTDETIIRKQGKAFGA